MRLRKKLLLLILFFMLIITFISSFSVVSASVSEGTLDLSIKMKRSSGYGYKFSANNNKGHSVWKIYENGNDRNQTIYCLKGGQGFGSDNMLSTQPQSKTYTQHFDMRNPEEVTKSSRLYSSISSEDNILLDTDGQNYKAIMWILDNCFILPETNSARASNSNITVGDLRRDSLLASAEDYAENEGNEGVDFSCLTDDDIDVVQQLAIWHYTNSSKEDSYNIGRTFTLWLNVQQNNVTEENSYKELGNGNFENGKERLEACQALFEYLIKIPENMNYEYNYKNVNSSTNPIKFSDTNVTMDESENEENRYILGPYKLEREASEDNRNYNLEAKVVTGDNDGAEVSDVKLLNKDKSEVQKQTGILEGTALDKLVGQEFYISIPKTENLSKITLKILGKYTTTKATYWSVDNQSDTEQPVVKVELEEHNFEIEKDFTPAQGNYEIELEKVDDRNTKLQGAIFEVKVNGQALNGETYTTTEAGKISVTDIPITEVGTQIVTITETKAPEGYSNQGITITLTVNTDIKNGTYVVKSITSSGTKKEGGASNNTTFNAFTTDLHENKIVIQMTNYQLDLALRKFITSIDGNDVKNKDGKFAREPSISEEEKMKLANNTVTTAKKEHTKDPLQVYIGSRVVYTIRVYNEGKIAAYAKKVTDYLPKGLKLATSSTINEEYGWKSSSDDEKIIETDHIANKLIEAFDGKELHYEDLQVECEVIDEAGETENDKELKNIAEITEHSDEYGDTNVKDRDSKPHNVTTEDYGKESKEDDDDFEVLVLKKIKGKYEIELEKVDSQDVETKLSGASFEIEVNGTALNGTEIYTSNNNGKINIKNIPISEETEQIITIKETKAPSGYSKSTDTITIKVTPELEGNEYVVKTIQIGENSVNNTLSDVTVGKTDLKANVIDGKIFVQMKNYKLDLALRKFIISIAGKELLAETEKAPEETPDPTQPIPQSEVSQETQLKTVNQPKYSREPIITDEELEELEKGTASLDDGTTAQKVHSKEPLVVQTGDKVIYIIRVYNEGKIAGYAKKVTDYLPEGLKFLPESEVNKAYGWKSTSEDGRTIETEKLAEDLIKAFDGEKLDYKDLEIECEVVAEAGKTDKTLKNIAEITKHSDENNDDTVEDRDSTPNNVEKEKYEDKSQEDDDDFENLLVEKIKDGKYSLEIEKVNGQNLEEKLEGAEFEIILPDGTRKTYTSNEQGKITIDELLINEVGEQIITIKETKAPSGYSKSINTIVVKVVTALEDAKYTAKAFSIKEVEQDDSEATSLVEDLTEIKAGKTELKANVVDGKIYIQMNNYKLDLALRKFITKVNDTDITNRVPVFTKLSETEFKYEHPKDPVQVAYGNIVTYTLRIFNEGNIAGYASKIKDDLPEGLTFLPDHETNVEYRWKMYTEEGKETDNVEEAKYIETDYLAKENEKEENANLLKAFDQETMTMPDYRDVKIAFKVSEPNTSDRIIINTAEITDDRDENNEPVDDVDSTPDNDEPEEDDIDEEKIKVQYFDLSLKKWVSESIVTYGGKTTVTKTGHTGDENPEPPAKVEIRGSRIDKTTVKFKFVIKVTNEGEIAGYAKELIDYIPQGLRFDPKDNPQWREEDGKVLTDQLKDTLLQPGESAQVEIILTWINNKNNLGEKVNWAEIYKDDNEPHSPDIDSEPGNNKPGEDDIDDAPVLLGVVTGSAPTYIGLTLVVISILASGVVLIKKFVI